MILTRHPEYIENYADWRRWRTVFDADQDFIDEFLMRLSAKESDTDYEARKKMAYAPAHASAAVVDIKNAIFQRLGDVVRQRGPKSYQAAVKGENYGVDFCGSSMGTYIGQQIIEELLVTTKVGVLVDNFRELDADDKRPYVSTYDACSILNWYPNVPLRGFDRLLLGEYEYTPEFNYKYVYRHYEKRSDGVLVTIFDETGQPTDEQLLQIERIPFTVFQIRHSLMRVVDRYQIAMLNLESSDISYAQKANYPFFYEFYDAKTEGIYSKTTTPAAKPEIEVGITKGRRYPREVQPPGFINPDPETLRVSMEKGEKLKQDIRNLTNLNLLNLPVDATNQRSLEASLAYIGQVLEAGERQIAHDWKMFAKEGEDAIISYPRTYAIRSDEDRQSEAEKLEGLKTKIPSPRFKKAVSKRIARLLIGQDVSNEELQRIYSEIDNADTLTTDTNLILSAHKEGLVDDVTAANAIGFDAAKVIPQAKKDRAERAALIMESQGGQGGSARGVPEFQKGQRTSSQEKSEKKKRGKQDNTDMGSEMK